MIIDEAHYFFGNIAGDDDIKECIRSIDGVPNADYKVFDSDNVFVFKKLLELVKESGVTTNTPEAFDNAALSLVPKAIMSPIDAVSNFGVIPKYLKVKISNGGSVLHHKYFHATIPAIFSSKNELDEAIATLLLGGDIHAQDTDIDFVYKNQGYKFEGTLSVPDDVVKPHFGFLKNAGVENNPVNITFVEGFPLLSKELFNTSKLTIENWENDVEQVRAYTDTHIDKLWTRTAEFGFDKLNNKNDVLSDEDDVKFAETLQKIYPELSMLSAATLKNLYDSFYGDEFYGSCEEPYRNEDFVLYLLGQLKGDNKNFTVVKTGQFIGHELLRDKGMSDALDFLDYVIKYDTVIREVKETISDIVLFLAGEEHFNAGIGSEITTFSDMARIMRKYNGTVITTQPFSDS